MKRRFCAFLFVLISGLPILGSNAVRRYLTTGPWYPADAPTLNRLLGSCFRDVVPVVPPGRVRGLVVPHAGLLHSGSIAARAFVHLQDRRDIRRVILLGVSHASTFHGACVSTFSANSTPLGEVPVDREIIARLARMPGFRVDNAVMQREHSLENQLPFLQRVLSGSGFNIVPILFGRMNPDEFAAMAGTIGRYVDRHTVVVASSDLTHYGSRFGFAPFPEKTAERLHELDQDMLARIIDLDHNGYVRYFRRTRMTMCGFVPVGVWMRLFSRGRHRLHLAGYATSGDENGNYSLSVGYGAVVAAEKENRTMLSAREKRGLLVLARHTLEHAFSGVEDEEILLKGITLTPNLKRRSGVFVTLKKGERLRGCIGAIVGAHPLYQGVIRNARNAAFHDPRFSRLKKSELEGLRIEISVMTPLQPIDDYRRIRLGVDGVVIRMGRNGAVYLPQVATETGWGLDEFLESLCRKAGLAGRSYLSGRMEFHVFQAQVFSEEKS